MLSLFGEDYEVIGGIYNELKDYYGHDFLFWHQFGRAEVYFDNFGVAENYLKSNSLWQFAPLETTKQTTILGFSL